MAGGTEQQEHAPDRGLTIIEILISMTLLGLVTSVLAAAVITTLKTAPDTYARIDDARSTRGLATWLSHDTTSAPPFLPQQPQGGMNVATTVTPENNRCGGAGSNLLHLQWTEQTAVAKTFVANYRFVVSGDEGVIVRYACSQTGSGPFSPDYERGVTPPLDPTTPPAVLVDQPPGFDVRSISFQLTGVSGEQVVVETSSRNPADYFP